MPKLRILLVDDHSIVRDGLKMIISRQDDMEVVGEADDGEDALQKVKDCKPDIVVMDVSMPRLDGAQATEQIKLVCPQLRVLALTAYEDKSHTRRLLAAGASGYLLKRAAGDEIIHALRVVAAGGVYIDPVVAGKVVDSFIRKPVSGDAIPGDGLSEREQEVVKQIAWGYSNKEIAVQLGVSAKTVETYKTRLMEKLGLRSRPEIVRYALEQGWFSDIPVAD